MDVANQDKAEFPDFEQGILAWFIAVAPQAGGGVAIHYCPNCGAALTAQARRAATLKLLDAERPYPANTCRSRSAANDLSVASESTAELFRELVARSHVALAAIEDSGDVPLVAVKELLGHASLNTTSAYVMAENVNHVIVPEISPPTIGTILETARAKVDDFDVGGCGGKLGLVNQQSPGYRGARRGCGSRVTS